MINENSSEILAPCGGPDSLYAAVRCGADAVYAGGRNFSARANASNFTDDELKTAVEYCHLMGVKFYIAINTIVFDSEMRDMLEFAEYCAEIGADAVIVQDLGTAYLLKRYIPQMPLHASTQMTVHTPDGADFMRSLGFSRVVLSRELSKSQIKDICGCAIDTEVFVHGALCMSVSGQCYMSALIGSRSANRGKCAQPCRLPYGASASCEEGAKDYPLSLKDLSIIKHLSELKNMGVKSFKIEGRMKRPEYVAAAVSACRNALDGNPVDYALLQTVFSRSGFTDSYYKGNCKDMFGVRCREDSQDADSAYSMLRELYRTESKKSAVSFFISVKKDKPALLNAYDSDGFSAEVGGLVPQTAKTVRGFDAESAEKQLVKLGDTIYTFGGLEADIDEGLMLPVSAVNQLRRNAVEALYKSRISASTPKYSIFESDERLSASVKKSHIKSANDAKSVRVKIQRPSQLDLDLLSKLEYVIADMDEIWKHMDYFAGIADKIIVEPPAFIMNQKSVNDKLSALRDAGFGHLLCVNLSYAFSGKAMGYILHGDYRLNGANSHALELLGELGFEDTLLSFEMKMGDINNLASPIRIGIAAYGHLPMMLTRNRPKVNKGGQRNKNNDLTDRTGRKIIMDFRDEYTILRNPEVLYLADKTDDFNVNFLLLDFWDEDSKEVSELILQYAGEHPVWLPDAYTRGLYYRGVL